MKDLEQIVIAMDGPSGTGKSTVGRQVARELGISFLSTGGMYRALGYNVLEKGIDITDEAAVTDEAGKLAFTFERQPDASLKMFVDGKFLGNELSREDVSQAASKASAVKDARAILTEKQREIGKKGGIILEGRDIGTVVCPDADFKFFITASAKERANRRYKQLKRLGEEADLDALLKSIEERDHRDSTRATAPLKQASDAVLIDTSDMTQDQVAAKIISIIKDGLAKGGDKCDDLSKSCVAEKTCACGCGGGKKKAEEKRERFYNIPTQLLLNLIKLCFRWYLIVFYSAKAEGLENIPVRGRLIIVSNHLSNVDPPLLGGFAGKRRDSIFVIKKSLMKLPVLGWLFKLFDFIAVDREDASKDLKSFKAIMSVLKKDRSVVIFPEGTRSKTGLAGPAKAGVSFVAHKTGAPVLISKVVNTYGFPKVKNLRVVYSHLIWFEEDKTRDIKEQYQEFADRIMSEIESVK
ncbi:cytidylate kinase [Parelusimicrobium proximum]|uniref:(d)CMP kinase n=1 Tax=Parelusimicrobium proximum TaxID=3228953 RepID=UPI003D16D1C7